MKWPMVSFSSIAQIITGNTPPKKDSDNYGPGVPWVKPSDLDAWEPVTSTKETLSLKGQRVARLLPPQTVMVCCIGSIGRVGIAGTTLTTNQQINSLVFGEMVEPKFGYYYCRFIPHIFKALARKAVVPILKKSIFEKIELPLPPFSEQRRIVEILDQANALCKKHAEAEAKVSRILQALFYKIFGDPVTNPKRWPIMTLEQVLTSIEGGWSPRCLERPAESDEWGVLKLGAVTYCKYNEKENKALPSDLDPKINIEVKKGDILFSRKNTHELVAACALVAETRPRLMMSDLIFRLNIKDISLVQPEYLTFLLGKTSQRAVIQKLAAGAAGSMPNISRGRLLTAKIPIPPLEKQKKFAQLFKQIVCDECNREKLSQQIDLLFQSLLHQAYSAKLTAKWREARMENLLTEIEEQTKYLEAKGG